jgi:regulator of nonsense transcripts 1
MKNTELNTLEQIYGKHVNASERQLHAFNYFVTLRNPEAFVDLHEEIPHLRTAI